MTNRQASELRPDYSTDQIDAFIQGTIDGDLGDKFRLTLVPDIAKTKEFFDELSRRYGSDTAGRAHVQSQQK